GDHAQGWISEEALQAHPAARTGDPEPNPARNLDVAVALQARRPQPDAATAPTTALRIGCRATAPTAAAGVDRAREHDAGVARDQQGAAAAATPRPGEVAGGARSATTAARPSQEGQQVNVSV